MTPVIEQWRPIPRFEGSYEASSHGRIRSTDRIVSSGHRRKGKILSPKLNRWGYSEVNLSKANKQFSRSVHRLVLEAFVGPCPPEHEACHFNDERLDNRLENLRWGTSSENSHDYVRNGSHHNALKDRCIRGHKFSGPNLHRPRHRSIRQCKSCANAYQSVRRHPNRNVDTEADRYYEQIMGAQA